MTGLKSPLRVTMVNKYYSPPHLGGVEMVVRTLAEGLLEHADGVSVQALVSNEGRSEVRETIGGVEVTRLARQGRVSSSPVSLAMAARLRRLGGRSGGGQAGGGPEGCTGGQDVIDLHSPFPWGELAFLRARPKVPSVVHYHSDIVRQKRMLAVYRPFLERLLDRVDLIVASSPNLIRGSEFLAPQAQKCRVVHFGLPQERLVAGEDVLRRAAELRARLTGRQTILFVGRLVYYKGVDVLVKAMAQVDADLVLIGEGPLEPALKEEARRSGIMPRITFLPPQDDAELAAWYNAVDLFCLPSVARSEAFGLVQIEAHAAGIPVVSTDLPTGVPFANLHEVTGLIVPPGDAAALAAALRRLLADDDLRARLGGQAQARALKEFTVPRMVSDMLAVYAEAVELHSHRSRKA